MDRNITSPIQSIHRLLAEGQRSQAEAQCIELYSQYPEEPEVLFALARVRLYQGNYDVCIDMLERCLRLNPEHHNARRQLLSSYLDAKRYDNIVAHAHSFGHEAADEDVILQYLAYRSVCDWSAADAIERRVIQLALNGKVSRPLYPMLLINFTANPKISPELNYRIHRICGQKMELGKKMFESWPRTHARRLRIAYLSADFYKHSAGQLTISLVSNYDKSQFEVFCYAHLLKDDEVTDQIRSGADHFINITSLTDKQVANRIHDDEIDILVELGGHTSYSRVEVLTYRPAPVQLTYLGYPVSTGLDSADFRVSCRRGEPDDAGKLYSEQLLLLPDGFLCRADFPDVQRRSVTPAESNGYVTFGSFNDVRKLNPETIALWSTIMQRIDGSRLVIKGRDADKEVVQQNLLREFSRHHITAERIEFPSYAPTYEVHVEDCMRVDLAFDPFPYHGTATTSETLWMGIPVLTLVGDAHVQRASYALMQQIGFDDATSAFSKDEYIEKAVTLASDFEILNAMRVALPGLMRNSSLCRPEQFMPQFEQLLLQACKKKDFSLPVADISGFADLRPAVADAEKEMILSMPGGVRIALPATLENRVTYVLSEQGDWYEDEIRFLRCLIKRGMHVLDINAGYGCYALSFARQVRKRGAVMAFETDPEHSGYLERSIRLNRLKHMRLLSDVCTDAVLDAAKWQKTDLMCIHGETPTPVLNACRKVLSNASPVVMLEAFSAQQIDTQLLAWMSELGYAAYRLVSGPAILVPADPQWSANVRQRHLFFCKADRATKLAASGHLVMHELDTVQLPETANLWISLFKGRPWTQKLLPVWKQQAEVNAQNPDWINLRNALHAYQLAQRKKLSPQERYGYLCASLSLALNTADIQNNAPRLSTCARIAAELGRDEEAIAALTILQSLIQTEQTFVPREPFLTMGVRYDKTSFHLRIADWMLAQVETQLELLQRPTAWADTNHLLKLEALLQRRDFPDPDITRRAQTAHRRKKFSLNLTEE